ncbi:MAG: glucose-1-phosphate thymidylyltransferase [Thermoplasmatales archaeon B_DKE]|nr:MAG: glucose-1-phosphate thymidylyltransferase [Thermoplasmatales archaeon B_DKE]
MKGVILHGGSGTRLRPLTYTDVKQLLPIAGKPVSEYILNNIIELGIKEINIIIGEVGGREVQEYYGDGSRWGVRISYTYQGKPLGIAHAIGMVSDFVGNDEFVVALGDNYFQNGFASLYEEYDSKNYDALIALTPVNDPKRFGIAEVEGKKIIKLVEKPKEPKSNLAIAGVYFLNRKIFPIIKMLKPSARGELEITDAIQNLITEGSRVTFSVIHGWWKDTGTVDEFLDCNRMVMDKLSENHSSIKTSAKILGRVNIEEGATVSDDSIIQGPCFIGSGSRIESSRIGPYTSIGRKCVISSSEIDDSIIMDNSRISLPGGKRMISSLIGPNVVIDHTNSMTSGFTFVLGRDSQVRL